MTYDRPLLSRILTWLLAGVLLILAVRLALFLFGAVLGVALGPLLSILFIIALGWLALRLWGAWERRSP